MISSAVSQMLDELTPYYKARMDELAPTKAKVLAVSCRLGREPEEAEPMSVKDVAANCAMSQQTVSKRLHELEKARFVRLLKNDRDKRASCYEPRDPLLKLCLELKGPRTSNRVQVWLATKERFGNRSRHTFGCPTGGTGG
jgi:DNA-binding MarR family transcriptional regulator